MMTTFQPKQPCSRQGASQNLSVSAVSAASTAFGSQTYAILLSATAACNVRVDSGTPTATTSDTLLPANMLLFFACTPNQKVAAVTASAATLNITELT